MDRVDKALLGAFLLAAALGTSTSCLLLNDGAAFLTNGWLGNAWDLYFGQLPGRAVALLLAFGPAWGARWMLGLNSHSYIIVAHLLYFAVPLLLWLGLRRIEPHRVFSRLYIVDVLVLIYFPSELIAGLGLWMMWVAVMADPARSGRAKLLRLF